MGTAGLAACGLEVSGSATLGSVDATSDVASASEAGGGGDSSTEPHPTSHVTMERPYKEVREAWLENFEREYVQQLLARHDRNVTAAAQAAGLNRTYIYRLINKHNL